MILNEESKLSFSQAYGLIRLMYKPFESWEAFEKGIIDENGKILKPGKLTWMELTVRNLKKLLLQHVIYKGVRGQAVLDRNLYRYIKFLKESIEKYDLSSGPLNEKEIMRISVSSDFEKMINKYE